MQTLTALPNRYITQQGNKLETGKSRVPSTVTNAVSWRSEGIKYKKNEVFIDVIESVNLLVSFCASCLGGRRGDSVPVDTPYWDTPFAGQC